MLITRHQERRFGKMMDFKELLRLNGIKTPVSPHNPNAFQSLLFQVKMNHFLFVWEQTESLYKILQTKYCRRREYWKFCSFYLKQYYGAEMPSLEEPTFKFKTPAEANQLINAELKRIKLPENHPFRIMQSITRR